MDENQKENSHKNLVNIGDETTGWIKLNRGSTGYQRYGQQDSKLR